MKIFILEAFFPLSISICVEFVWIWFIIINNKSGLKFTLWTLYSFVVARYWILLCFSPIDMQILSTKWFSAIFFRLNKYHFFARLCHILTCFIISTKKGLKKKIACYCLHFLLSVWQGWGMSYRWVIFLSFLIWIICFTTCDLTSMKWCKTRPKKILHERFKLLEIEKNIIKQTITQIENFCKKRRKE